MKYLKIILLILFLNTSVSATMLLGYRDICIEDFYLKNGDFYYYKSSDENWYYIAENNIVSTIIPNYIYDVNTTKCEPNLSYKLGLEVTHFNFLMALSGLIFSFIIFVIISNFLVGF